MKAVQYKSKDEVDPRRSGSELSLRRMISRKSSALLSVVAILSGSGLAVVISHEAWAAPSATSVLSRLKADLSNAARAAKHHHLLSATAYAQIRKLAIAAEHKLSAKSSACRSALGAARRLAGERRHRTRLQADVRHAIGGLARCAAPSPTHTTATTTPTTTTPMTTTPTTTTMPITPAIGGTVVNSGGQPLAGLPITVTAITSPRGRFYGSIDFDATTDSTGHFVIAQDPSTLGALDWTATASFAWYGGSWLRNLTTLDQSNAAHLAFRSDLTAGPQGFGLSLTDGALLRLGDWDACSSLNPGPNHPATDPNTTALILTFTPAGPVVDGTTGTSFTSTVPSDQLCDYNANAVPDIPAGAWYVTAVTNQGRQIAFSFDPGGQTGTEAILFNAPQSTSGPLQELWVDFADQVTG